jgi:large subunit ribosomal protein L24e
MVVKTQLCMFSESRIFPGHGMIQVRRDGQPLWLSGSKCRGLYANRKRPAKLSWTQAWRRLHKKDQAREGAGKKKARKRTKFQRSVVGASIEEVSTGGCCGACRMSRAARARPRGGCARIVKGGGR